MAENAIWTEMVDLEFRELANNAPVMIWRARTDKLCDWFNKPWQDFSGKTQEQLFGYGWAEDVHPEDFDRCVKTYVDAFDARESFTMPYRLRRHDGVYCWFLDNGAPYYRNGEFAGYFGSCIDITEQRNLEEHQRTLLAELNHRVKNNLQLILSFLQLSKMRAVTDEAKEVLTHATARIRAVGVIQDELFKHPDGMLDLGDYLQNLVQTLISIEIDSTATLVVDVKPVAVPFETASNIGLAVNELVTNSLKHGKSDVLKIGLGVALVDNKISVTVTDNGNGFEVIEPSPAHTASGRGTGLVSALAKRLGATVTRANLEGASVTLLIPVTPPN